MSSLGPFSEFTVTLARKNGSSDTMRIPAFGDVTPADLPLAIERVELKNGYSGWAKRFAALMPHRSGVKRRYERDGETLVYREV